MSDGEALLAAILAHPAEDAPRLVYADWLEENDDPDRAALVRGQVRGEVGPAAFRLDGTAGLVRRGNGVVRRSGDEAGGHRGGDGAVLGRPRGQSRHHTRAVGVGPVTDEVCRDYVAHIETMLLGGILNPAQQTA